METLATILQRQHGVVTRPVAIAHLGKAALRWRLAKGRWQRPFPGVLVAHSGPLDREQRLWAAILVAGSDAVLAGLTAAVANGLQGFTSADIHLLVSQGRKVRARPGIVVRRSRFLDAEDVHPVRLPPRTRMARSLVDAAAWAPTNDYARSVLAAGVQQRRVRVEDLRHVLSRLPTVRRRNLMRQTFEDVVGGAQALSELDVTRILRRFGLPAPDRQVVIYDERGRRRWVDACYDEWKVVIEIDGMWHMEARAWWSDMLRDNALIVSGDRVLRFPAFILREQPRLFAEQVAGALRAAGWPG